MPLKRNTSSSGVALFMVLILTTIMFLIAGTMLIITMTEIHLADFEQRSTQAFYLAESGITLGLSELRASGGDYRHTKGAPHYTLVGGNPASITTQVYETRSSLYHLMIRGIGVVSGSQTQVKRTVQREVLIKPFVLFAQNKVILNNWCTIDGNIHANNSITIADGVKVEDGNISSSGLIEDHRIEKNEEVKVEPKIPFPDLPLNLYTKKAQPLFPNPEILLPEEGEDELELRIIEIFKKPHPENNPDGVFYIDQEIPENVRIILNLEGTLIIYNTNFHGMLSIKPVENLPALITVGGLNITLDRDLEKSSSTIKKSLIEGLIYSYGSITLTGINTTGSPLIIGSLFGNNITITGNPSFQIKFDPAIFADPPPGLELIDFGEWDEVFE